VKKSQKFYHEVDELIDKESFIQSIEEEFNEIEDPRWSKNRCYSLVHLLVIILCAILAGANTITDIYSYSSIKFHLFSKLMGVETPPSYSVFWWLMTRLDPKGLEKCLVNWIQGMPPEDKEKLVAIDGKHLRGAARNKKIHFVSAWESHRSLLLGQVKAEEKSNEITAIPELLENLDIAEATVTIDAAGCQTAIIEKIVAKKANYLIALKGNQGTLLAEAENFFRQAEAVDYEDTGCEVWSSCEKGHGRIEERQIVVINDLEWLQSKKKWTGLSSLVEVTCHRTTKGKITKAKRYFISSQKLKAEKAAYLVRSHWLIENHLHWNMDVNFDEDKNLASTGHAAENLGFFRRMAATLIKLDLGSVRGTAHRRRQAKWDDSWALRLLSRVFEL
jgi:predicted transposase YbfD/YdcC